MAELEEATDIIGKLSDESDDDEFVDCFDFFYTGDEAVEDVEDADRLSSSSCDDSTFIHPHEAGEKRHVERRHFRRLVWGSIGVGISIGRALSQLGVRGAHLSTIRRISRLSAGIRSQTHPRVHFSKAKIGNVKVRVFRPVDPRGRHGNQHDASKKLPVVIFLHGGAWVMCSARVYHSFTLDLAADTGAVVVSVDYRLAPEHPHPAALEDCLVVARCLLAADSHPDRVGHELAGHVDVDRIVIGGDSAGGNLAGATCLDLLRSGQRRLAGVMLVCPSLQAVTSQFASHQRFSKHSTARAGWFIAHYAGVEPTEDILRAVEDGRHVPADFHDRFVASLVNKPLKRKKKQPNDGSDSGFLTTNSMGEIEDMDMEDDGDGSSGIGSVLRAGEETSTPHVPSKITQLVMSPRAWPLLAKDSELARMPATMIQVCSDDALLDEGRVFAHRMRQSGAKDVRYFYLPRAQHCEAIFHKTIPTKAARRGYSEIVHFIKSVTTSTSSSS